MKKLFLLLVFTSFFGFYQVDSIKVVYPNIEPGIVQINSKLKEDIYKDIKAWIQKTYVNPDFVLKADVVNDYIRFDGYLNYVYNWMGKNIQKMYYTIIIEIKDNKYKVEFFDCRIFDYKKYPEHVFEKNGKLKKHRVAKEIHNSIIKEINKIHFSIFDYINGNSIKSDW